MNKEHLMYRNQHEGDVEPDTVLKNEKSALVDFFLNLTA
jgi:hypothetical protein